MVAGSVGVGAFVVSCFVVGVSGALVSAGLVVPGAAGSLVASLVPPDGVLLLLHAAKTTSVMISARIIAIVFFMVGMLPF